jgi:uncharacterized protein
MDFLILSRGTASAAVSDDDPVLNERHWAYMDAFADAMTARGPTLGPDRLSWSGSLHVVELPSPEATREFVEREPYNRAGLFEEHRIWRFVNILGETMWHFVSAKDEPRFLVLAHPAIDASQRRWPVPLADLPPELRDRLIVYGELRTLDDDEPAGVALAVQAATPAALEVLLRDACSGLADCHCVEIHDWEFGGRR